MRTFTKAVSGETQTELQRSIVNGAGETLRTGVPNTVGGVIYTRNTYNARGQLTKTQTDAGNAATTMAPTLWEYDAFGNKTKETWKLADPATVSNSRITTWSYGVEQAQDGVYRVVTATRNNSRGTTCDETQKTLASSLSSTLESKVISIDPRGNASEQWSEYGPGAVRTQKSSIPTSNVIATATVIDGFTTTQTDHAGVTATHTRAYTETGVIYSSTDGRGNTVTTHTDRAGRTISVTDAAGNTTSTAYGPWFDQPAVVTNALGNTTCYGYDLRGRNTAQWGTGTQPLLFGYDEADRMISLTTFREDAGDITADPTGRTDGDVTTWSYDDATGLLIRKTWADGTHEDTAYNALNFNPRSGRAGGGHHLGLQLEEGGQQLRLLQRLHARHPVRLQPPQPADPGHGRLRLARPHVHPLQRTGHRRHYHRRSLLPAPGTLRHLRPVLRLYPETGNRRPPGSKPGL
ncbi:MAG: hypothetical protein ACLT8E_10045 [Akkermansia sp.]